LFRVRGLDAKHLFSVNRFSEMLMREGHRLVSHVAIAKLHEDCLVVNIYLS
jgi:hypothetical protein